MRLAPTHLLSVWNACSKLPGGGRLFGRLLGTLAPYTGTIRPEVLQLEPGFARVRLRDTRRVRNHLNSVHAIALMNLGEVATGLAVISTLGSGERGIISKLSMDYVKKARGPLVAECRCPPSRDADAKDLEVEATLSNEAGDVVARAHAKWRVGR